MRVLSNGLVHTGLCERWLINLIVSILTVTDLCEVADTQLICIPFSNEIHQVIHGLLCQHLYLYNDNSISEQLYQHYVLIAMYQLSPSHVFQLYEVICQSVAMYQ